jgi:hypothetical protein
VLPELACKETTSGNDQTSDDHPVAKATR